MLHARRRLITLGGWAVTAALGAALLGVVTMRLWLGASWWWVVPVSAVAAAMAAALAAVWTTRWTLVHAAGEVDRANGTDSAIRTALEINDHDGDPALVAIARSRGERLAGSADPAKAVVPARIDGWWWAMGLSAACVVAGLFVPPIDRRAATPDPAPVVRQAAEQARTALEETAAIDPATLPDPASWSRIEEELASLEEELARGVGTEDAPARTAAALQQAAEELDRQNELSAREQQALRDRAADFQAEETGRGAELSERLADALARNDMLAAEEAAREIDRAIEEMSESEREQLMRTLEDLASTLDPADASTPPAGRPDMPDGPDEADPLAPESSPDESPATGQDSSREPEPPADATPPETGPRSLPETLRDRARDLGRPPQPQEPAPNPPPRPDQQDPSQERSNESESAQGGEEPTEPQPNQQPGQEQPESEGSQGSERSNEQNGQQQPGQESGQEPNQQPSQESGREQGQEQNQEQGQNQSQRQESQPGQQQEQRQGQGQDPQGGREGQQRQGSQSDPGAQPQPGGRPEGQPEQQPGGEQPSAQPGEGPGQQPGETQGPRPDDPTGDETGESTGEPRGSEGLRPGAGEPPPGSVERAVRELREGEQAREQNRRVAESLRDRAEGLIDPGREDRPPGPGGAGSEDGPLNPRDFVEIPPEQFEPVDASGPGTPDPDGSSRVVGEWFDPDRTDVPAGERRAAAAEMRRAAREARDAVENQQVPRRYRDLIQQVFDRVDQRAEEVGGAGGGIAPQGRDASP